MCLVELLILENLHFATDCNKLCVLEQKLLPFTDFGSHLGGYLEFTHLDTHEVILEYLVELLIYIYIYENL